MRSFVFAVICPGLSSAAQWQSLDPVSAEARSATLAIGTDGTGRSAIEWGVYGMPETFVVNGKGEIVFKHVGPITPESIKAKLIPAIEKARSATSAP